MNEKWLRRLTVLNFKLLPLVPIVTEIPTCPKRRCSPSGGRRSRVGGTGLPLAPQVNTHMHTLEQLRSGALAGTRRLDLNGAGLTHLPPEVYGLADTLEVLNQGVSCLLH